jgi:hypothetical protein
LLEEGNYLFDDVKVLADLKRPWPVPFPHLPPLTKQEEFSLFDGDSGTSQSNNHGPCPRS